jgi:hypothetical protein
VCAHVDQLVDPLRHPAQRRHNIPVLVRRRPVTPAPRTRISQSTAQGRRAGRRRARSSLEDAILVVDGDGVRDGDGGGGRGSGREGLELVERGLETDPLGLVQRDLEVPHVHQAVSDHRRRTELRKESRAAKTLSEPESSLNGTLHGLGWKTPKRLGLWKAQNEASLGWARFDVLTETSWTIYPRSETLSSPERAARPALGMGRLSNGGGGGAGRVTHRWAAAATMTRSVLASVSPGLDNRATTHDHWVTDKAERPEH